MAVEMMNGPGRNVSVMHRLHLIPRVSAEKFLALIEIADLLLHPFPFDGSRTR
jgi:predicted O-linked N-acetylglucosamine transferase (SPINDLY family)